MKALQIVKPREFRIVELDDPTPAADEVVIHMEYAAMCNQNDTKIFYGLYGDLIKYPCDPGVYGHEGVGIVTAVGKRVRDLAEGDRVILMGEGGPMCYMEYVTRKAGTVAKISRELPAGECAVLELFGCAHHCMDVTGDVTGRKVGVMGLGPAGLAIVQMLMLRGPAEVVGMDIDARRRDAAKTLGVKKLHDPSDDAQFKRLVDEKIDVIIDATGVPEAMLNSFEITAHEVVIFGFTNKPFTVDQSKWFQKELVIRNSKVQTIDDLRAVARLLEEGKIRTKDLIDDIVPFEKYAEAVERLYRQEAIKILLTWEGEGKQGPRSKV